MPKEVTYILDLVNHSPLNTAQHIHVHYTSCRYTGTLRSPCICMSLDFVQVFHFKDSVRLELTRHETDLSPPSNAEVKNEWS